MPNIVYLLGAGASARALPVISDMNSRMEKFLNHFIPFLVRQEYGNTRDFSQLRSKFCDLLESAKKHSTIDTYAKKLFLQKNIDDLQLLKFFISTYLIYEQTLIVPPKAEKFRNDENLYWEGEGVLDSRYDSFLAAALYQYKDMLLLNQKISILSWNYDYQLELSYKDFSDCTLNASRERLKFFNDLPSATPYECKVVKLNGTADLVETRSQGKINGSTSLFPVSTDQSRYSSIYKALMISDSILNGGNQESFSNIKFAWETEQDGDNSRKIEAAKYIVQNASVLVIIGYSFPVFNRVIDKEIFSNNQFQRIYFQCLEHESEGIRSRIVNTLQIPTSVNLNYINDLSQFYLPYEL